MTDTAAREALTDDELERLEQLALGVPDHIINHGFVLSRNPVCGEWFLYSDNGKGCGRQYIASFPAGKHYFGTLAQFMEAMNPRLILRLIAAARPSAARPDAETVADAWQPIETAPADVDVMLGWWEAWPKQRWVVEFAWARASNTLHPDSGASNGWLHGMATHWFQPTLPAPPIDRERSPDGGIDG